MKEDLSEVQPTHLASTIIANKKLYSFAKLVFNNLPEFELIGTTSLSGKDLNKVDFLIKEDLKLLAEKFINNPYGDENELFNFTGYKIKVEIEKFILFQKVVVYNLYINNIFGGGLVYSYFILPIRGGKAAFWQTWISPDDAFEQYYRSVKI